MVQRTAVIHRMDAISHKRWCEMLYPQRCAVFFK